MFVTNKKITTTIVAIAECLTEAIKNTLQDHKENIVSLKDEIRYIRKYQQDLASRILSNEEMIDNLFSRVFVLEKGKNKKATIKGKQND